MSMGAGDGANMDLKLHCHSNGAADELREEEQCMVISSFVADVCKHHCARKS